MAGPHPFRLDRTLTYRLHTLNKLTDRVTQQAYRRDAGIGLGEGRCLSAVGAFGPLSVNDLAASANVDKAQASRAAQALVHQGLVRKSSSRTDARGVVLALTPDGERVWERLRAVVAGRNAEIAACLDEAERDLLDRLVDKLVAHARAAARGARDAAPARDEQAA